jgi:hypothetical protein
MITIKEYFKKNEFETQELDIKSISLENLKKKYISNYKNKVFILNKKPILDNKYTFFENDVIEVSNSKTELFVDFINKYNPDKSGRYNPFKDELLSFVHLFLHNKYYNFDKNNTLKIALSLGARISYGFIQNGALNLTLAACDGIEVHTKLSFKQIQKIIYKNPGFDSIKLLAEAVKYSSGKKKKHNIFFQNRSPFVSQEYSFFFFLAYKEIGIFQNSIKTTDKFFDYDWPDTLESNKNTYFHLKNHFFRSPKLSTIKFINGDCYIRSVIPEIDKKYLFKKNKSFILKKNSYLSIQKEEFFSLLKNTFSLQKSDFSFKWNDLALGGHLRLD